MCHNRTHALQQKAWLFDHLVGTMQERLGDRQPDCFRGLKSDCVKANALVKVATFSEFTRDNDPYEEHDFGFFQLVGRTFYWKIDYYDERCEYGSLDPADPEKTIRVLTLMLAEDY